MARSAWAERPDLPPRHAPGELTVHISNIWSI
jgi:hypothetical protein